MGSKLLKAFLDAVQRPVPEPAHEAVTSALADAVRDAKAAWPQLTVEPAAVAGDLARVLGKGRALGEDEVRKLRASDVFVVSQCLRGDAQAIVGLEREYFPKVRAAMARQVHDADTLNELLQIFRERLLVGPTPALGSYAGRGALGGWLCAIGVRQSLDYLRANKRFVLRDEVEIVGGGLVTNQEMAYAQKRYAREFQAALRKAFSSLDPAERRLLRHAHLDGLSIDAIAQSIRVHRSTAARQLNKARDALIVSTRRALRDELDLSETALDSLMRSVHADLDVSLSTALGTNAPLASKPPR